MTRTICRWFVCGAALIFMLAPLRAHHVIAAKFDSAKTVTLRGAVTAVDWANPHAHVFINVAGPA